jgi:hypothetical protein
MKSGFTRLCITKYTTDTIYIFLLNMRHQELREISYVNNLMKLGGLQGNVLQKMKKLVRKGCW